MDNDYDYTSDSYVSGGEKLHSLDVFSPKSMMSVYCECGRIVVLDRAEMKLKLSLGKDLQCMKCRNIRISQDIDYLNALFDGTLEENLA